MLLYLRDAARGEFDDLIDDVGTTLAFVDTGTVHTHVDRATYDPWVITGRRFSTNKGLPPSRARPRTNEHLLVGDSRVATKEEGREARFGRERIGLEGPTDRPTEKGERVRPPKKKNNERRREREREREARTYRRQEGGREDHDWVRARARAWALALAWRRGSVLSPARARSLPSSEFSRLTSSSEDGRGRTDRPTQERRPRRARTRTPRTVTSLSRLL